MPDKQRGHLSYEDRCDIARMLSERQSFSAIAKYVGVAPSTISREVCRNRTHVGFKNATRYGEPCVYMRDCDIKHMCTRTCNRRCAKCKDFYCSERACLSFVEMLCSRIESVPHCCNGCKKRGMCSLRQFFYRAKEAQQKYEKRLVDSRRGISASPEQIASMISTVKALSKKGQSIAHIWESHGWDMCVSKRTFYRHLDKGLYSMTALDLPRKFRYKPRKKHKVTKDKVDFSNRTYSDFLALDEQEQLSVVQVDCIEGFVTNKKVILTLFFVRFNFQICILLPEQTQEWVVRAFDWLEELCEGSFSDYFGLMLLDRGREFLAIEKMERSKDKTKRTSVYFCDPGRADQKGACEKNHVEIRKILPKKRTDFDLLTSVDMADISSHINSYTRASLGGKTPYSLAACILPESLLEGLGISLINPDDVCLTPDLLKLSER